MSTATRFDQNPQIHPRTSSVFSLPPLCELIGGATQGQSNLSGSTRTTPEARIQTTSASSSLSQGENVSIAGARPPPTERINTQPSFRRTRLLAATPPPIAAEDTANVQDVSAAIASVEPDAKIAHVHNGQAVASDGLILVSQPADFSSCFGEAVPLFVLVDGACQESVTLVIQMLRSQADRFGAAIIVVFLQPSSMSDSAVIAKVPEFVASGADDVIVMQSSMSIDAMHFPISISLAKAKPCRDLKIRLRRQLESSRRQCHHLFWEVAHEIVPDFPQWSPGLNEARDKRVGSRVLEQRLGAGAFGTVYKWQDHERKTSGAVKVVSKSQVQSANQVLQLSLEFQLLQRLRHQNVVAFEGTTHGLHSLYLFMENAGTRNLFRVIHEERASGLPWSVIQGYLSQLAAGVAHCHENRVAHCDLKPENIVISDNGCAKIIDFGQALDMDDVIPPLHNPRGTMPFMAPEIMCCSTDWEPAAADIWSLGVILMEMLGGNHSFENLLGWRGRDLMHRARLGKRADELKNLLFTNEALECFLELASNLCFEPPPETAIRLLGDMLQYSPGRRICATDALARTQEIEA